METVKNVILQSIRNESDILTANLTNRTVLDTPLFRLYQMRERFSVEINNFKLNRKYLEQEIREIRVMLRRRTKALIPIVGKVLSFLFGTLVETDLNTIKTNVRHLANNQQQIKHVLTESMTFIKDSQQNINENRKTRNSIITSPNASMTEQLSLNKQMHDMQIFNDIYIRFDRTLSSVSACFDIYLSYTTTQTKTKHALFGTSVSDSRFASESQTTFIRNCESITRRILNYPLIQTSIFRLPIESYHVQR